MWWRSYVPPMLRYTGQIFRQAPQRMQCKTSPLFGIAPAGCCVRYPIDYVEILPARPLLPDAAVRRSLVLYVGDGLPRARRSQDRPTAWPDLPSRGITFSMKANGRSYTSCPHTRRDYCIEKVIPRLEDLATLWPVLATSGTGQPINHVQHDDRRTAASGEADGPEEFHVVLLDNDAATCWAMPKSVRSYTAYAAELA